MLRLRVFGFRGFRPEQELNPFSKLRSKAAKHRRAVVAVEIPSTFNLNPAPGKINNPKDQNFWKLLEALRAEEPKEPSPESVDAAQDRGRHRGEGGCVFIRRISAVHTVYIFAQHVYTYVYIYIHVYMYVCMYACIYLYIHIYVHGCIYVCGSNEKDEHARFFVSLVSFRFSLLVWSLVQGL